MCLWIYRYCKKNGNLLFSSLLYYKQIDIWGSAYAVEVGITSKEQTRRIATYLAEHYDETVMNGQIRHLTRSEGAWNSLFKPCEEGTYQNGAYWATPLAWMIPVYARYSP